MDVLRPFHAVGMLYKDHTMHFQLPLAIRFVERPQWEPPAQLLLKPDNENRAGQA
jgi:hypothetical protein